MVKHPGQSRADLNWKIKHHNQMKAIYIGVFFLIFLCCCQTKKSDNTIIIDTNAANSAWADLFADDTIINFTFPDSEKELIKIARLVIDPDGQYFVIDSKLVKIFQFDSKGKFIRSFGNKGAGPGEFQLPGLPFMDTQRNLYIYDVHVFRISKFNYPDYAFEKTIQLKMAVQSILAVNDGFILYTVSDHNVLHKIDKNGEIVKKAFQPAQINFRVFSGRFQMARIRKIPGDRFLFTYPDSYNIYLFDENLNQQKILTVNRYPSFFPKPVTFPQKFSPYDFNPGISKWWGKNLRVSRAFYLHDGIVIMELLKFKNLSSESYYNVHTLDGKTLAAGLKLPFDGYVIYTKDDFIYIIEESKFDNDDEVIPFRLHRFRFKNLTR